MSTVNISGVDPVFFIVVALFLLFILGMLAFGILRMFQEKVRAGIVYIAIGLVGIAAFAVVLNVFYL